MQIEVSIGEVVDKFTILSIKLLKIEDKAKLENVNKERIYLAKVLEEYPELLNDEIVAELRKVNMQLWDVEDKLREHERQKKFNDIFIQLARSVYHLNDKRAQFKKGINVKYGSNFIEEKSYQPY